MLDAAPIAELYDAVFTVTYLAAKAVLAFLDTLASEQSLTDVFQQRGWVSAGWS